MRFSLGLSVTLQEEKLKSLNSSSQIINFLADLPASIDDVEELIAASLSVAQSLHYGLIESQRRKHLAYLMADQGAIINPAAQASHLPKQVVLLLLVNGFMKYIYQISLSTFVIFLFN